MALDVHVTAGTPYAATIPGIPLSPGLANVIDSKDPFSLRAFCSGCKVSVPDVVSSFTHLLRTPRRWITLQKIKYSDAEGKEVLPPRYIIPQQNLSFFFRGSGSVRSARRANPPASMVRATGAKTPVI